MKFNLRDLFWLVLLVAVSLGWWLELTRRREVQQLNAAGLDREKELLRDKETLSQQYVELYKRHAESHRFHFDIFQSPDRVEVKYVDDTDK